MIRIPRFTLSAAARRRVLSAAAVAAAVLIGLVVFGAAAADTVTVGPVTADVRLGLALDGDTVVKLPPFGSVRADTHVGFLKASISLAEIDPQGLEQIAATRAISIADLREWQAQLTSAVLRLALTGAAAAVFAAALVGWVLARRRREAVIAATVTALIVSSLWLSTSTFSTTAFSDAQYEGALRYAPAALAVVQQRYSTIEDLKVQVGALAENLAAYYGVAQSFQGTGPLEDSRRVLLVSDVHLDPVGIELTKELARSYEVDLILDTGDMSHFGTETEGRLAGEGMGSIPRVYVPGNHDSPVYVSALRAVPTVTVLDGETTTTPWGLSVLGIADPASGARGVEPDADAARAAGEQLAFASGEPTPSIVAVHDPASGEAFEGAVRIVVSGHTHTPMFEERSGTLFLSVGTTGGVHFSALRADPHIPNGAIVLYYSRTSPPRLLAVEQIEVFGKEERSSVRRTVFGVGDVQAPQE